MLNKYAFAQFSLQHSLAFTSGASFTKYAAARVMRHGALMCFSRSSASGACGMRPIRGAAGVAGAAWLAEDAARALARHDALVSLALAVAVSA